MQPQQIKSLNDQFDHDMTKMLPEPEAIYKDIHRHLELSIREFPTAKIAMDYLAPYC